MNSEKLQISRPKWKNNIRNGLKEIGVNTLIDSGEDRNYWRALVNAALNLQVP